MPFEIESTTLIYICAALSVVLFVEAIYLLGFSTASYRGRVNRRLRLMQDGSDSQAVLLQLRRERGLTSTGLYGLPTISLNRLILQSGLTITPWRGVLIVGGTAVAVFLGVLWLREDLLEAAIAAPSAALVLPYLSLHVLRRRRQRHFAEQFADAIDIIVRSLRAGHPVPVAIGMVAREMGDPVGTEFGIVADEITYGADLETAMRNLSFRVGQEDLPLFVTAVAIQGSTGGNLSEILSNLSATIRQRFKMRRKIRALASEGRFSAYFLTALPLVIFGLLEVVSPDFYGSIWDQDATKIGLGCAAGWMLFGNFVMYRMVNFRI
jgi:tight adherence protein B